MGSSIAATRCRRRRTCRIAIKRAARPDIPAAAIPRPMPTLVPVESPDNDDAVWEAVGIDEAKEVNEGGEAEFEDVEDGEAEEREGTEDGEAVDPV